MKGKYLYGIIRKPKRSDAERPVADIARSFTGKSQKGQSAKKQDNIGTGTIGTGAIGIGTVNFRNLSAVISEAKYEDYSSLAKKEVLKKLTSHQQIIEKIMKNFGTVLPVEFGTILKDEEAVRLVLKKGYVFLRQALEKMENKIELDLACFWDETKAAQSAYQENPIIKNFYKKIVSDMAQGTKDKITLGKLVAGHLASKKKKISNQILKMIEKHALETCRHTLADVNMILNYALLIGKENQEEFIQVLNSLDRELNGLINFRLVGPLPPYSFTTLVVEDLQREEVEAAKKLLKLDGELSQEKIKHNYNKLASCLHPDKGGDPLSFKHATRAYKLLRKYAENGLIGVYLNEWEEQQ